MKLTVLKALKVIQVYLSAIEGNFRFSNLHCDRLKKSRAWRVTHIQRKLRPLSCAPPNGNRTAQLLGNIKDTRRSIVSRISVLPNVADEGG